MTVLIVTGNEHEELAIFGIRIHERSDPTAVSDSILDRLVEPPLKLVFCWISGAAIRFVDDVLAVISVLYDRRDV